MSCSGGAGNSTARATADEASAGQRREESASLESGQRLGHRRLGSASASVVGVGWLGQAVGRRC